MRISAELLDALVAHALEDPGNEVCGLVAVTGEGETRRAARVYRARNVFASPMKFATPTGASLLKSLQLIVPIEVSIVTVGPVGSGAGTAGPDAGRGKSSGNAHGAGSSCKPLDGGRSPCADGEDDDMDDMDHVDGGDMDRGDEDGVHRRDAGKMD